MPRPSPAPPRALGLITLATGLFIMGIGLEVVPVDPASVHAPMWVLVLCGAVFVLGGVGVLAHGKPEIQSAAGGTIVLVFGVVGGWVALFGEAAQFGGGFAFLSPEANVAIARGVFGLGALVCLAMFAWGTRRMIRGEA
ncbi:MAG TPA: hypothetical protein EYQ24_12645 [Bacteroidetes bacterium]|nr:hypothetical protein [Bacteroidota bacterium]